MAGNGDRRDGRAGGGDGARAAEGRKPDHELIVAGAVAVAAGAAGREEVVGDVGDDAGASVPVSVSGPAPQKLKCKIKEKRTYVYDHFDGIDLMADTFFPVSCLRTTFA